jgi:hypothetical protein
MRRAVLCLAIAGGFALPPQGAARFLDAAARGQFEQGRAAIFKGKTPEEVRSMVLKGRLRQGISRDQAVDGLVEIRVLLPDRYLRIDTLNGVERRAGLAGRTVLTSGGELNAERASFTRLMLGLAAHIPAEPKLTFQSTGETAFAHTVAVDVTGQGFAARLVFDGPTHVPLRLVYDSRYGAGTVMSFANRRGVDGIELPSRVTTLIADRVLETLMFDEMHVNVDLRDSDFRR